MHVFDQAGARLATVTASTDAHDLSGAFGSASTAPIGPREARLRADAANASRKRSLSRNAGGTPGELEERDRIVHRSLREARRLLRAGVRSARGGRRRRQIARPAASASAAHSTGPSTRELAFDRRKQERRELRRPVDAETRDLIAHPVLAKRPSTVGRVLLARMAGDLRQRRDRLVPQKALEETAQRRRRHRLVDEDDAGQRREIRHARSASRSACAACRAPSRARGR